MVRVREVTGIMTAYEQVQIVSRQRSQDVVLDVLNVQAQENGRLIHAERREELSGLELHIVK